MEEYPFIMLINIPLFILGWRGVSKHFVILSAVSIVLQTVIMNLLSMYTISPFVLLIQDGAIQGLVNGATDATLETYGITREVLEFLRVSSTDLFEIFKGGNFNIYKRYKSFHK